MEHYIVTCKFDGVGRRMDYEVDAYSAAEAVALVCDHFDVQRHDVSKVAKLVPSNEWSC